MFYFKIFCSRINVISLFCYHLKWILSVFSVAPWIKQWIITLTNFIKNVLLFKHFSLSENAILLNIEPKVKWKTIKIILIIKLFSVYVEPFCLLCLVSQEVNFKLRWRDTNKMCCSLVSLKVSMGPCPSRYGVQLWNPAAEYKVNAQSKAACSHSRFTTGFRWDPRQDGGGGLTPGPLAAWLLCSHGLLRRNLRTGTFGSAGVDSFGLKVPRPMSTWRDEQLRLNTSGIIHLRPQESASIQGTQPRFSWPLSKRLMSRIMHHLLCLSGKQMEVVVIGVTQRERTRSDQPASWEITLPRPFFFFLLFSFLFFFLQALRATTLSRPHNPPFVFIVVHISATPN